MAADPPDLVLMSSGGAPSLCKGGQSMSLRVYLPLYGDLKCLKLCIWVLTFITLSSSTVITF